MITLYKYLRESLLIDFDDLDNEEFEAYSALYGAFTCISADGKYIFYPDKISKEDRGFNLYFKEVKKPDSEAVKIASDVANYYINSSATVVTYLDGDKGNLYQYNIKKDNKEKIASDVEDFYLSDDGKKIIYLNSDNNIYLKKEGKDKDKIAGDVSSIEHITEDFKTVYYTD